MRYSKNERGYALFITLVIIILFSILGITMLGLTSDGMKKNNIRKEEVQVNAQAEKGIDRIVAEINTKLKKVIGETGIPRNVFENELHIILNSYLCGTAGVIKNEGGKSGKYEVCIHEFKSVLDKHSGKINSSRKLVSFESTGYAGSLRNKKLITEIEIGAEVFPETMKYALGSNITSKSPKNGEGDLVIHGGALIQGDIKVDGDFTTSSDVKLPFSSGQLGYLVWEDSVLPEALPAKDALSSKLVLGGDLYLMKITNIWGNEKYEKKSKTESLFLADKAPHIVKRDPFVTKIEISDKKELYEYKVSEANQTHLKIGNRKIYDVSYPVGKTFISYKSKENSSIEYGGTYNLTGNNIFNQLATKGNIEISSGNHSFKSGLYIEGNLTIGKKTTSTDFSSYVPIGLDGPIYVKGDLTISGTQLYSNALLYVEGKVTIDHSTINGPLLENGTNSTGSLIVFSEKDIDITFISSYENTPSTIKGFFYTKENFEIYGGLSNIKIHGGISAKSIKLNAVRGETKYRGLALRNGYDSVTIQKNRPSRLQVIYDAELIENFLKLNKPEPIIRNIDPSFEKSRNF